MSVLLRASHWLRWVARGHSGSAAVVQSVLVRVLIIGTTLLSGVLSARNLGPTGRGIQSAMMLWPSLLSGLLTIGVPAGLRYQARKHTNDQASLFSAAIVLSILFGSIATLIGVIGIPHWLAKYDVATIRLAQWLMVIAPLAILTFVLQSIFEVRFDFTSSNTLRYAPSIFVLAALVVLVFVHNFTPFATALIYAIAPFPFAALLAFRLRHAFKFTLVNFETSARRLIGYGAQVYVADVLNAFGSQVDQLLVIGMLSAANLGTYTVALTASRILNVFQTSVTLVLLPKASGLEPQQIGEIVGRAARVTSALTFLSGIILILVIPTLLPFLYGSKFAGGVIIAQILTVESVIACTTIVLVQTFMATNRPGVVAFLQVVGLSLAVPLLLLLIPRYGLVGAAIALLISTGSRLLLALASYPLLLKLPPPSLILNAADLAYVRVALRQRGSTARP